MNRLVQELDEKLRTLDPEKAANLASMVRDAIRKVDQVESPAIGDGWPAEYFAQTSGALAGERLERAPQGELQLREDW